MRSEVDTSLLLLVLLFYGLGLVQVYSSSFIFATETREDGLYFFKRQALFTAVSVSTLLFFTFLSWAWVKRAAAAMWAFAFIGICIALHPGLGHAAGGAARWINLGFFKFEPSELLKVVFPFVMAFTFSFEMSEDRLKDFLIKCVIVGLPIPILLLQPDFGTVAIYVAILLLTLFMHGLRWRYVLGAIAAIIPTFYFLVMNVPYRRARLMAFLDPWADPAKTGFQVIQSLLSFSSGGLLGQGLGDGQGKLFFLPEAHTDFTLAVLGEETGFIGFASLFLLYGMIIFKGFVVGINVEDKFAKTVALGSTVLFSLQVFTNAGVVLGLLPPKGLTLPFLSYGGSSLVVLGILFGILLNIERTHLRRT